MHKKLPPAFYLREDVLQIAQDLLGKILVSSFDGVRTSGIITEVEAYRAPDDRACHAYGNRFTPRTSTMFESGGIAYIYLCYGIHHLFNVVTGPKGMAHAVLIRSIEPFENQDIILERRGFNALKPALSVGPGALTKALGITTAYNGIHFLSPDTPIWIEDAPANGRIEAGPRIGVDYAGDCAQWPWRFWLGDSKWVKRVAKK